MLLNNAQQLSAVVVDELAREDDHARLAGGPTGVQHLSELGGEARGRLVVGLAGVVVGDAGLGGVGDDDLEVVGGGELHDLGVVLGAVGVHAARAGADQAGLIDGLAVLLAADEHGVEVVLGVDAVGEAVVAADGLDHADLAVPAGGLVAEVKEAVDEGAQEVALTELQDLLGGVLGKDVAVVADLLERGVAQGIHGCSLLFFWEVSGNKDAGPAAEDARGPAVFLAD